MRSLAIALLLSTFCGPAWGKPCIAAARSDLPGAWIAEYAETFYLLELDDDAQGVLVTAFGAGPHQTYDVSLARLAEHKVEFRVQPLDSLEETAFLKGNTCRGHLYLEFGSRASGWKVRLDLKPRDTILNRIKATSETAETLLRSDRRGKLPPG